MAVRRLGRRLFLAGAGGALAIPMMRSLLPASVAKAATERPRCLVVLRTEHGGALPADFFPDRSLLTETDQVHDWTIRHGAVARTVENGRASLSRIVTASEERLTAALAQKLGFLMGIDYATRTVGHQRAAHLGGYAQGLLAAGDRIFRSEFKPTVDQVVARSPGFYADAPGQYVVSIGSSGTAYYSNPQDRTGLVVEQPSFSTPQALWEGLFEPGGRVYPERPIDRPFAVDRAIEGYRQLVGGAFGDARRLSGDDRNRLEEHIATLHQVENQLRAAAICDAPTEPGSMVSEGNLIDTGAHWAVRGAIIRQAVACGISRVFSIQTNGTFVNSVPQSDFHQEVPHRSPAALLGEDGIPDRAVENARNFIRQYYQGTFENAVLPIIEALDFEDSGCNVLDESLLLWTSECGSMTHQSRNIPLLTAGSLGGRFRTGRFVDYQNQLDGTDQGAVSDSVAGYWHAGLPYDQLLGNIVQAFDVPLAEYDAIRPRVGSGGAPVIAGFGGYRSADSGPLLNPDYWTHSDAVRQGADAVLPQFRIL